MYVGTSNSVSISSFDPGTSSGFESAFSFSAKSRMWGGTVKTGALKTGAFQSIILRDILLGMGDLEVRKIYTFSY
jgi:hypothetical protein